MTQQTFRMLCGAAIALLLPGVAAPSQGKAVLRVEQGLVTVDAMLTLRVAEILVPPGAPAAKGQALVRMDTKSLQNRLEATREELAEIQRERRNPNPSDYTWATREMEATRELMEIQSRLGAAAVNAPDDGYVVRTLTYRGGTAKRRKPLLEFVPLSGTRIAVVLPSANAALFREGAIVSIQPPTRGHGFRSRVEEVEAGPSGNAALVLVPLELPFLRVGEEATVELEMVEPGE